MAWWRKRTPTGNLFHKVRVNSYVTEHHSNGLEWTKVGHILVTVKG